MPEPFIEDLMEVLKARQQGVNNAINELTLLVQHGDKFLVPEKAALISSIIASLDVIPELPGRALFQGNRRP